MQAQEELKAILGTKEGQEQFMAWLASPITQLQLRIGRDLSRPCGMFPGDDAVIAAYRLGDSVGGNKVVDAWQSPLSVNETNRTGVRFPEANYGVDTSNEGK